MNTTGAHLLIVDDDPNLLRLMNIRLKAEGYRVSTADSGAAGLAVLARETIDLVISDLRMEGMNGIELFEQIQHNYPGLPVIIITAQGSIADAVAATQKGVFGFLIKPVGNSEMRHQILRALDTSPKKLTRGQDQRWREAIKSRSEVMENLLATTEQVAGTNVSVLISGQSGTGKELLAQAIHRASARNENPFVAINCSALPEPLLESELFGHVRGAFSGAVSDHQGLLRAADGGTLFLDEIGDMPLPLQAKLLRVLQDGQVRPVGSTQHFRVDVRILSATHRDLELAMEEGLFRQDLYYRLNVVNLHIPALRERAEDIPLLIKHFLLHISQESGVTAKRFSPDAIEQLVSANWPGNVRQLENFVQQLIALTPGAVIGAAHVRQALSEDGSYIPSFNEARRQFEHEYLSRMLRLTNGNVSQAARLAQRNRTDFYKLLQRHGIKPEQFKEQQD